MIRFLGLFLFIQLFFLNIGSAQNYRDTLIFTRATEVARMKLLLVDRNYTDTVPNRPDWKKYNNSILRHYFHYFPDLRGAWHLYKGKWNFRLSGEGFSLHKYQENAIYFSYIPRIYQTHHYDMLIDTKNVNVKKLKVSTMFNKNVYFINFHYQGNCISKMDVYKVHKRRRKRRVIELKEEDMTYKKSVSFVRRED